MPRSSLAAVVIVCLLAIPAPAEVYNLKVATDASPDYSDLPSMVRSITANWPTPEEKCWALFYWGHKARRQTTPMEVHGLACTDPIRQFNDYGYTMCSTIAGVNCSVWNELGYKVKYWDISMHTVSEVEYGGRYHLYDNSMSAIYTLCDGQTIAGVEDIGKEGACGASGGKKEPGHIAKYHCLTAGAPISFLTGADCARSVAEEYRCFNPNGLKHRYYFHDWDRGHRYIWNLKEGESYTRHYRHLGAEPKHYVPNNGRDPEVSEHGKFRFRIRGNGVWEFKPAPGHLAKAAHWLKGLRGAGPEGVEPLAAGAPGEIVFKIDGANVITGMALRARLVRRGEADLARISVSATNGLTWTEVWKNGPRPEQTAVDLVKEANGAYHVLVKFELLGKDRPQDARLEGLEIETTTQLNSKTQPRLLLGKNTVRVASGEPTDSIVVWPDLRGELWKPHAVDHKNVAAGRDHPGYLGVLHAAKAREEAYVVFKIDAPRDITRLVYGGRLYNRAPKSHIDFLHSFDGGKTWIRSYSLTDTQPPWDVIRYETVSGIPAGTKSILVKYLLEGSEAGPSACSLYAVRIEANCRPADPGFKPLDVTFRWSEVQPDRSLVRRGHTERVVRLPHTYTIAAGGADHPVVESLRVGSSDPAGKTAYGYSDGREVGGGRFVPRWVTYGRNLALGKPYTVSVPSGTQWGAGDPEGKKLTDGIIGPPYAGGIAASFGLCWTEGQKPAITVDLQRPQPCGAFRIHLTGYPFWDALKGEVQDRIEVLTSTDGKQFTSRGPFDLNLRWKDLPANLMWPDEENATAPVFDLVLPEPVEARFVQIRIAARRFAQVSEVQVLDRAESKPFDLRIALPGD